MKNTERIESLEQRVTEIEAFVQSVLNSRIKSSEELNQAIHEGITLAFQSIRGTHEERQTEDR